MNKLFSLKGKVIVVTGAAGLLGRQHVKAIAMAGGIPILLDINSFSLESIVNKINLDYKIESNGYKVDITNEKEVKKNCKVILKKYRKIDGLINNAANNPKMEISNNKNFSRLENFSTSSWENDISVGLKGAFLCSKHYGKAISNQGGSIINVSSDLGVIAPDQRLYRKNGLKDDLQPVKPVTYSVIKSGLIGLTKYLSTYWLKENVRCNAICPGGIETEQDPSFIQELCKRIPMGRMAKKSEYQGVILFLLSEASSYMTGSIINIDGGRTSW
ncbi:MAG: oxidoreductase [Flavobacteriaceae bacterium]|nr:oxidoreductase [Flavobacteriaceae bacterium]